MHHLLKSFLSVVSVLLSLICLQWDSLVVFASRMYHHQEDLCFGSLLVSRSLPEKVLHATSAAQDFHLLCLRQLSVHCCDSCTACMDPGQCSYSSVPSLYLLQIRVDNLGQQPLHLGGHGLLHKLALKPIHGHHHTNQLGKEKRYTISGRPWLYFSSGSCLKLGDLDWFQKITAHWTCSPLTRVMCLCVSDLPCVSAIRGSSVADVLGCLIKQSS